MNQSPVDWAAHLHREASAGRPVGVVTVLSVRGHAPCSVGAKMVVTPQQSWGSVGGGALECAATEQVREALREGRSGTSTQVMRLGARDQDAPGEATAIARQCCGGEVTYLVETWATAPACIAVFGMGHIGVELGHALSRSPIRLYAIDSRADHVHADRLAPFSQGAAHVIAVHAPVPEAEINSLPAGTHVIVMTHDHAEDLAIIDQALRRVARDDNLGTLGVIGSRTKWSHFSRRLLALGHTPDAIARVDCPIGVGSTSKQPTVIALSVAAAVLQRAEQPVQSSRPAAAAAEQDHPTVEPDQATPGVPSLSTT